ncbi:hypothetical protein BGZ60DRAFT_368286 [Tricladium varicosporioides]|nr:hypothetical protein BGZ60DRAFT_368286 [Hymenoscyphus varicosporioides]
MATRSLTRSCTQLTTSHSTSPVRAFLALTPRRHFASAPLPVLDFLLPPSTSTSLIWNGKKIPFRSHRGVKRAFTSTANMRQTSAILNPRKDEDGNEMGIDITPRASNRLREIMSQDSNPNLALRIQVESGGCHGFQYLMDLVTLPPLNPESRSSNIQEKGSTVLNTSSDNLNATPSGTSISFSQIQLETNPAPGTSSDPNAIPTTTSSVSSQVFQEDDTVFQADDGSGAKVVMDEPSLELLKGSKIDFVISLIGSEFKIVDNPLATSSCGCGTSFDIKI